MPKIALNESQREHNRLQHNMEYALRGMSVLKASEILGWSVTKLNNKITNPENLSFSEMKHICNVFRVDFQKFIIGELEGILI